MRRLARTAALTLLISGCAVQSEEPSLPFEVQPSVETILDGWREAGIDCGQPSVGEPGPQASWGCRHRFEDVDVSFALTATRHGVESIIAGVPPPTDRDRAARAFVGLLNVTCGIDTVREVVSTWLVANHGWDGSLPIAVRPDAQGHATVATEGDGSIDFYLVPDMPPQPLATFTMPPDSAGPRDILEAYLHSLVINDCAGGRPLGTATFATSGDLCGVAVVWATSIDGEPAVPNPTEVVFATTLLTSGSRDGSVPRGNITWYYTLRRQPDGTWRLAGGGTGP